MYRRGDPRWNRTFQHIADNIEHANESAQENLYSFTHRYVGPCLSSVNQCLNACTAPCFPAHNDRRRGRGRVRGRAEQSFDFYDDWEDDETDGLLGWGSDNLERFLGSSNNYGATAQPGRQASMNYPQRTRDNRFNTGRRKSIAQPREGPDPTIIPSSSYFGFLGRLPFKFGSQVLRYKPSAADLTEHPGARRSLEEQNQPLIEDSDEERHEQNEHKRHRRQRSHTDASGHTTDSLSSRGDIFPSEDEDDAVPLDDEFTAALERRTTGQWNDETSSSNARSGKSKRKSGSRVSSRNTHASGRKSMEEGNMRTSSSETIEEVPTLADLKLEEERLRIQEEADVERKRQEAQQLAWRRGLTPESNLHLQIPSPSSNGPKSSSSHSIPTQMAAVGSSVSPLVRSPAIEIEGPSGAAPFPNFEPQTMPDSGSFHVDESDYSSMAPTPNRPLSINEQAQEAEGEDDSSFIPARLPHFDSPPG